LNAVDFSTSYAPSRVSSKTSYTQKKTPSPIPTLLINTVHPDNAPTLLSFCNLSLKKYPGALWYFHPSPRIDLQLNKQRSTLPSLTRRHKNQFPMLILTILIFSMRMSLNPPQRCISDHDVSRYSAPPDHTSIARSLTLCISSSQISLPSYLTSPTPENWSTVHINRRSLSSWRCRMLSHHSPERTLRHRSTSDRKSTSDLSLVWLHPSILGHTGVHHMIDVLCTLFTYRFPAYIRAPATLRRSRKRYIQRRTGDLEYICSVYQSILSDEQSTLHQMYVTNFPVYIHCPATLRRSTIWTYSAASTLTGRCP
jgi:hypothetical protein